MNPSPSWIYYPVVPTASRSFCFLVLFKLEWLSLPTAPARLPRPRDKVALSVQGLFYQPFSFRLPLPPLFFFPIKEV